MMIALVIVLSLINLILWSEIFYRQFFKRFYDIVLSGLAIIVLSPVLLVLTILGAIKMKGNPFFTQKRPGRNEKLFILIKFRSMSNLKDDYGQLLPDEQRLNKYGVFLRSTSLDELPELLNILIGDMSFIGPRPQLVRDMVFMSEEQRRRHEIRPGLSGLAQVSGRNSISWERKFFFDLQYLRSISFFGDMKIAIKTVTKVLKRADTVREGTMSDLDYGDWLLKKGEISREEYTEKQNLAKTILGA